MIAIDWNPDTPKLRQFAYAAPVGFGLVGLVIAWRLGATLAPSFWLWGIGLATLVAGLIKPISVKPLYLLLSAVTAPIGFVIGNLALLLVYALLLVPIGLVFKLIGRDTMMRKFRDGRESHWQEHRGTRDLKRYYRQY